MVWLHAYPSGKVGGNFLGQMISTCLSSRRGRGGGSAPCDKVRGEGEALLPHSPTPFCKQALQIFKDDVYGFSSFVDLDISFMIVSSRNRGDGAYCVVD